VKKRYRVEISAAAQQDVRSAHDHIAADNPQAAVRWLTAIEDRMLRLEGSPLAHEVIPESAALGVDYRQRLYGKYRIIYRVRRNHVLIIRVIHGARLLDRSMFK
jgi:plasmid stabilization system protein ParE